MAESEKSDADLGLELLAKVRAFVDKHEITCAETIHQTDRVIVDATPFIQELVEIAGYCEFEDEEDDE